MRKRRHHTRETKNGQNFARLPLLNPKAKKEEKKKKRKKEQTFPLIISLRNKTRAREREREREKKRMREENIIVANKDTTERMTTRERQHIEVAKLEAELNALKVDAFAKVRLMRLFF